MKRQRLRPPVGAALASLGRVPVIAYRRLHSNHSPRTRPAVSFPSLVARCPSSCASTAGRYSFSSSPRESISVFPQTAASGCETPVWRNSSGRGRPGTTVANRDDAPRSASVPPHSANQRHIAPSRPVRSRVSDAPCPPGHGRNDVWVIGHKAHFVPESTDTGTNPGPSRCGPAHKKPVLEPKAVAGRASVLNLQAGGHRFDPGWLHSKNAC